MGAGGGEGVRGVCGRSALPNACSPVLFTKEPEHSAPSLTV